MKSIPKVPTDPGWRESPLPFAERPVFVSFESEKVDWSRLVDEIDLPARLGDDRFAVRQRERAHRQATCTRRSTLTGVGSNLVFEEHFSGVFGEDIAD